MGDNQGSLLTVTLDSGHFPIREVASTPVPDWYVLVLVIAVIATGAGNDVSGKSSTTHFLKVLPFLGKIVTVPMAQYSFVLGVFSSGFYIIVYFTILLVRYQLGWVSARNFRYVWRIQWEQNGFLSKIPRVLKNLLPFIDLM